MARQQEKGEVPKHVREAYQRGFNDGLRQIGLPLSPDQTAHARFSDTYGALVDLMAMGLRHVRFISKDYGKTVYCKAGIGTLTYPKHYLLYVATNNEAPYSYVPGLRDKVLAFEEGRLRPSPDNWE